jgi:hypothetical protein
MDKMDQTRNLTTRGAPLSAHEPPLAEYLRKRARCGFLLSAFSASIYQKSPRAPVMGGRIRLFSSQFIVYKQAMNSSWAIIAADRKKKGEWGGNTQHAPSNGHTWLRICPVIYSQGRFKKVMLAAWPLPPPPPPPSSLSVQGAIHTHE